MADILSGQRMPAEWTYDQIGHRVESWVIHKFGINTAVPTSLTPLCLGGNYRTPTAATTLEIVSDDVDDTSAGAGAQAVQLYGLDANGDEITTTVEMNGTTAVEIDTDFFRLHRIKVIRTGSYANQTTPSQQGNIIIRESGAGDEWARLNTVNSGFGGAQSQIGAFSVPRGYAAFFGSIDFTVDSNKSVTLARFARANITDITTPFTGVMQLKNQFDGVSGPFPFRPKFIVNPLIGPADVGFMGYTSTGTASVSVDFDIILIREEDLQD